MGWTYSGNPGGSSKDAVRFLIHDTNTSKQLVQDEEIEWAITQEANIYCAAAAICDSLTIKAGGVKYKKIGELAVSYDPAFYTMLSGKLRARGAGHQVPYAGGISIAGKLSQQIDTDAVQPKISIGIEENPAAPSPSTPSSNPLTTI